MTKRLLWIGALLLSSVLLAGCGVPDEQEADENAQSERESVGEGEVPGFEAVALVAAGAAAVGLYAWRRRG